MSLTFISPAISSSNIKMKWREQYVTSGLNKKAAGVVASGIYRGFSLGVSGSNNTVTVVPDSTHQDHLAVYETADGFSLTIRDASNATYSLALTDASLYSQTVLITIFADYQEGSDTTATFAAYTLAEFAALSASLRSEIIVLGTVVNPAASNTISAGSITSDGRTVASFNQSALLWRPLLINTGFERALDGRVITGSEVEGWVATSSWQITSSDVSTGIRCIEYNPGTSGTKSEHFRQYIGIGCVAGQQILVKISKKIIGAASGGTGQLVVGYTGSDGGSASESTSAIVINSTDGSYQTSSVYFVVPSGAICITYIGFSISSAVYGTSGVKIRIDNLSALLQPLTIDDQLSVFNKRLRQTFASSVVVEDVASTSYSDNAALLSFLKSAPTTEGTLSLQRKDGDYTSSKQPPALQLDGRIISLGEKLLSTSADALKARITAPISTAGGATYTLLQEHAQDGETTGTYTNPVLRIYCNPAGHIEITNNAVWGGTTWSRDVSGQDSSILILKKDGLVFDSLSSTADGAAYTENAAPWANPWYAAKSNYNNSNASSAAILTAGRASIVATAPIVSLGNLTGGAVAGSMIEINGSLQRSTSTGNGISRIFPANSAPSSNSPPGLITITGGTTEYFPIPRIEFDEQITGITVRNQYSSVGAWTHTYSFEVSDDTNVAGVDQLTGLTSTVGSPTVSGSQKVVMAITPAVYTIRQTFWLKVIANGSHALGVLSYQVFYTKLP